PALPEGGTGAALRFADLLCDGLAGYAAKHGLGGGVLRSKLIRTLPTTLAVGRYGRTDAGLRCEAIWAGDSRVYLLTPAGGLHQLPEADLRSGGDGRETLERASPLNNLVCASSPFVLHTRMVAVAGPAVLLAATDGCFGYVSTPLHFEHLL